MKHRRALFLLLCFRFAELFCTVAVSSRNDATERQQVDVSAQAAQSNSLLAIMMKLQNRMHPAAVASEVQVDRRALSSGQTVHERQLLSDMGRLESQLESWKQAEQNLEHQVAHQAQSLEEVKDEETKAIHDEQVAAIVWWDCKMLMCFVIVLVLGFFAYSTQKEGDLSKPCINAAESPKQTTRKGRVQTEFVEKDAKEEAEDFVVFSLPPADIEAPSVHKETEDIWKRDLPSLQDFPDETTPVSTPRSDSSKCQYFNMAEEQIAQKSAAEDAWWNDSSAGY